MKRGLALLLLAALLVLGLSWSLGLGVDASAEEAVQSAAVATSSAVICYSHGAFPNETIWSVRLEGTGNRQVTTGFGPCLSPDSRYLLSKRGGTSTVLGPSLYVRDLVSGAESKVFDNADYITGYSWTNDSAHIIYDYQFTTISARCTA